MKRLSLTSLSLSLSLMATPVVMAQGDMFDELEAETGSPEAAETIPGDPSGPGNTAGTESERVDPAQNVAMEKCAGEYYLSTND